MAEKRPSNEELSLIEAKKRNCQELKEDLIRNLSDVRNDLEKKINEKEREHKLCQQEVFKMKEDCIERSD